MSLESSLPTILSDTNRPDDSGSNPSPADNVVRATTAGEDNYNRATQIIRFLNLATVSKLQPFNLDFLRASCEVLYLGQGVDYRVDAFLSRRLRAPLAVKYVKYRQDIAGPDGSVDVVTIKQIRKVEKEAQILCHPPVKKCPFVCEALGYGWEAIAENTFTVCLVIEYALNGNLRQWLQSQASKPPDTRHALFLDVAKGLDVLHACQIVHGDVKMENVLVFEVEQGRVVAKLSDFGSAILQDTSAGEQTYWGTALYNSPAVRSQQDSQSGASIPSNLLPACDVYSLGLLAWETFLDGQRFADDAVKSLMDEDPVADLRPRALQQLASKAHIPTSTKESLSVCLEMTLAPLAENRPSIQEVLSRIETTMPQSNTFQDSQVRQPERISSEESVTNESPPQSYFGSGILEWVKTSQVGAYFQSLLEIYWQSQPLSAPVPQEAIPSENDVPVEQDLYYPILAKEPRPGEYPGLDLTNAGSLVRTVLGVTTGLPFTASPMPWSIQKCIALASQEACQSSDRIRAYVASLTTSVHYFVGFGVDRDLDKSLQSLHSAARLGCPEALILGPQLFAAYGKRFPAFPTTDFAHHPEPFKAYIEIMKDAQRRKPYTTPFFDLFRTRIRMMWTRLPTEESSSLHRAAVCGNGDLVESELSKGVRDHPDAYGQTALLLACRSGSAYAVYHLLVTGSDPAVADSCGITPLHLLVMFQDDHIPIVGKLLMDASPTVNLEARITQYELFPDYWDTMEGTPLEVAVKAGNVPAVRFLVSSGANSAMALGCAVGLHRDDLVEILLQSPTLVQAFQGSGLGAPTYWLSQAHPFRRLLMHGEDHRAALVRTIKLIDRHFKFDPVMTREEKLVNMASFEMIALGNAHNPRPHAWNSRRDASLNGDGAVYLSGPLQANVYQNLSISDGDIAEELLKITRLDSEAEGIEMVASAVIGCRYSPHASQGKLVSMLLDAGYPADQYCGRFWLGYNAFHFAVKMGSLDIAEMLLRHDKTLINSRTKYLKETPLHIAARTSTEMVRFLTAHGADALLTTEATMAGNLQYGHVMDHLTPLGAFINEGLNRVNTEILPAILDASRSNRFVAMKEGDKTRGAIHLAAICSAKYPERSRSVHETLRLLLEHDELREQINDIDSGGRTPLFLACVEGGFTAARILIEAGADPRVQCYGISCLEYTLLQPRLRRAPGSVPINMAQPIPIDAATWYKLASFLADHLRGTAQDTGLSPIHLAVQTGNLSEVRKIIQNDPESVLQEDLSGKDAAAMIKEILAPQHRSKTNPDYIKQAQEILGLVQEQQAALKNELMLKSMLQNVKFGAAVTSGDSTF